MNIATPCASNTQSSNGTCSILYLCYATFTQRSPVFSVDLTMLSAIAFVSKKIKRTVPKPNDIYLKLLIKHLCYTCKCYRGKRKSECMFTLFDNTLSFEEGILGRVFLIPYSNWFGLDYLLFHLAASDCSDTLQTCFVPNTKFFTSIHTRGISLVHRIYTFNMLILLGILYIIVNGSSLCFGNVVEDKILKVGEELWRETLPLQGGSRFYQLQGLKPHMWYEVKISYPASIPASFSIELKRNKSDVMLNNNRRLLNTEKLIFKTYDNQDESRLLLVSVEAEGFPAKLHVQERQFIIFNIVCDELLLGIPHKAWWVVAMGLLCLGIGFILPSFLPFYLLPKNQASRSDDLVSKIS
ncbi:hypothetical protein VNO77_18321 [Canavalia gladiata]|uniref:Transmembrane protein n=1 Tax=Canavalia gladiata TaxID=3824 RepID=A0AAN9LKH9_CANGL